MTANVKDDARIEAAEVEAHQAAIYGWSPAARAARAMQAGPELLASLEAATARCQEFLDTFGDMRDYVTQAEINDWHAAIEWAKRPSPTSTTPPNQEKRK